MHKINGIYFIFSPCTHLQLSRKLSRLCGKKNYSNAVAMVTQRRCYYGATALRTNLFPTNKIASLEFCQSYSLIFYLDCCSLGNR